METALLLHNIRSAHNVGSLFRTADGAGVSHVYLSGYTPRPVDRFKRAQKDIAKTALGAELAVAWTSVENPLTCIADLRADGWCIAGIEQDPRALPYTAYTVIKPTLFIVGEEVEGMTQELKDTCDVLLEIPMRGTKESLNVSVAAAIVLYASVNT